MMLANIKAKIKTNKLLTDSLWSLGGNVVGKGLALLAGILVARFLGKDIYGEYGIIRNTILTIGVFSTFGLGYTATKYIAGYKKEKPEYIQLFIRYATQITLVFSGIMALLLFTFAPYVADQFFEADHLTTPLRFLAILIIFNAITTTQIGILAGFGTFNVLAKINGVIGVITFLLSVLLTYYWHFEGALLALLIAQVVNCVLNFFAVRKNVPSNINHLKSDIKLRKEIIQFSTPIALQEAVYATTAWIASILLVQYASFGELGMYTAAMQWNAIILFIPGILRNVVLSHLSTHSSNAQQHDKILKQTLKINFVATLIPCVVVAILAPWIATFYGNTFNGLAELIAVAVFSTILTSVSNVYAQAYTSLGRNWEMLCFKTLRDVLILGSFIILVKNYSGSIALIISHVVMSFIFLIIIILYFKKNKRHDKL